MEPRRHSSIMGLPAKHVTLIMLTIQNSALILIMHYSRIMPPVGGHRYLTSTAVFLNEVFKLAISLSMALYDVQRELPSAPATVLFSELFGQVFTGDSWKLAVPAMLYTLQNSLQYIAVSNLDAATFQVTYQLKILSTAIFSVILLNRKISAQKWLSLIMLMVGVAIVQIPTDSSGPTIQDLRDEHTDWGMPRSLEQMRDLGNKAAGQLLGRRSATYEGIDKDFAVHHPQLNASAGLAAVLIACVLSGLAGVYFEKLLKDSATNVSVWIRNVQLSFYSLFPALFIGVMFKDGADISKYGFFSGYNWVVWAAILCQASGGVIVSLSIFHTSNIAKNFATSISILLSFLVSVFFFDFKITLSFVAGTAIVLGATYLYSASQSSPAKTPIVVTGYEKHGLDPGTPSYLYTEKTGDSRLETPRSLAHTSSRPTTPTSERRHHASKLSESRFTKRDE